MTLDDHDTLILAILVLFLGRWVNRRLHWLREYGIPEPVTGGLIASAVITLLVLRPVWKSSLIFPPATRC